MQCTLLPERDSKTSQRVAQRLGLLWTLSAQQFGISIAFVVVVVAVAVVASAAVVLFMSFVMFLQIFLCK